ncbi:MAG: polyprenol monophosphomannose synthase [Ardenticatenaceae bacterium]|nr:polyprenol monophosphomannose synthase [Ardenticatenaceae bacterium]HBY99537.1 polyprenol monophosphomannose synthase [Chloroflexota bacterium]
MNADPGRLRVAVVLPTFNEAGNIGPLIDANLQALTAAGYPAQVIVVDDDSPDGTWQVVENASARDCRIRLIRRTTERGLTSAIWTGIQAAEGADVVCWMDCDFSMPPEMVPDLVRLTETRGADVAVGSRYLPGGSDVAHSVAGQLLSRVINGASALVLDPRVTDYTSGFVAARRPVLLALGLRGDYGEYCIDLLYRALKQGLTVVELPYRCAPRRAGESKTATNLPGYLRRGRKYVTTVLGLRFGVRSRPEDFYHAEARQP